MLELGTSAWYGQERVTRLIVRAPVCMQQTELMDLLHTSEELHQGCRTIRKIVEQRHEISLQQYNIENYITNAKHYYTPLIFWSAGDHNVLF